MTVDNELVHVGTTVISNGSSALWMPSHMMTDWVNSEIPTQEDILENTTTQLYPIGSQLRQNGCLYRYSKAGNALAAAYAGFLKFNHFQCPGLAGNSAGSGFEGALYAAVAAQDQSFAFVDTAATENLYAGAEMIIFDGTYGWHRYTIIGNDASDGTSTTCYLPEPGFSRAVTTSPGISVYLNKYQNIRAAGAGLGGWYTAMGYTMGAAIASGSFFWLKTAGVSWGTMNQTYAGQTAYQRGLYVAQDGSLIGTTSTSYLYQFVGTLLYGTSSSYGDLCYNLQLDQAEA